MKIETNPKRTNLPVSMTLADVIKIVKTCPTLTTTQKRDLASAVRRVAAWLDLLPENISADRPLLRKRLDELGFGGARSKSGERISKGRYHNVSTGLNKALEVAGIPRVRRIGAISAAWRNVKDATGSIADGYALSKFGRWCTGIGVEPGGVDDGISQRYLFALTTGSLIVNPREKHQELTRAWNRIVALGKFAGLHQLTVPKYRDGYGLPPESFRASFREDTARYVAWLQSTDVLAEDAPIKPVRPATARIREKQIYVAASVLHHQGVPTDDIADLTFLVRPENVHKVLRFFLNRSRGEKTKMLSDMAEGLFKIALRWVKVDEEWLDQLRDLRKRTSKKTFGMTEANRAILRRFNDHHLVEDFKRLPAAVMAETDVRLRKDQKRGRNEVTYRLAITYQKAAVAMILQWAPMRAKNLAGLHLDRHLNWTASHGKLVIFVPGDEVKNEEELVFELPEGPTRLLRRYMLTYRPILLRGPNDYLFPGENGGHKSQNNLSQQLAKFVHDHLGIRLTAHRFRHVMGKIFLDANPGQYEVVRRVLGHRSIETTVRYYAGEETTSALKHYHSAIFREVGVIESDVEQRNAQ